MSPYKFLRRSFLVMSPFFLTVLAAEAFLWLSGETVPIRVVATRYDRTGPPSAYLPALVGQQFNLLHYERVKKLRPEVLVLGSSRVTRFRQEMFGPNVAFYNSGRTMSCVGDLEEYFASLPADYAPKALLLGVDRWWFKENLPTPARFAEDIQRDDTLTVNAHVNAYRKIYHSIRRGSLDWPLFWKIVSRRDEGVKRFGLIAWRSSGMRNDGSNQTFDRSTPAAYHDMLPEEIREILNVGHPALIPASEASDALLARFEATLKRVAAKGTVIVAFTPPFASEVIEAYERNPVHYGFYRDALRKLEAMFQRNGWHFYDGSNLQDFGLDDRSMKDRDHAQETYHVALLLKMAAVPAVRQALQVNPEYLQALLSDPDTTPWYPDYSQKKS